MRRYSVALATLTVTALLVPSVARAGDGEPPGWGMAIAARIIGEKCQASLKPAELVVLNDYITSSFSSAVEKSSNGPAWWGDLRDKLEKSYVEKYSDPANCTDGAREEAEDLVSDVREYQKETGK